MATWTASISGPVLVRADGRRVSVLTVWTEAAGELRPQLLVPWESAKAVALQLRRTRHPLPPGMALPLAMPAPRPVSVTLPNPLGDRRLVDATEGHELRCFHGSNLARITWLPAGYRFEGDDITRGRVPGTADEPLSFAWDRTYGETGTGAHRRLVITQVSGLTPQGAGAGPPVVDRGDVGGRRVAIHEQGNEFTTGIADRAVTWSTADYSYTIDSTAGIRVDWDPENPLQTTFERPRQPAPEEEALSPDTLLRIVAGMEEP